MQEIFNTMPNYTQPVGPQAAPAAQADVQPISVKEAIPAANVNAPSADTVEISSQKAEKKGPIKAVKGFIADVKKFFESTGEYIKGTVKGVANGVVAGSVIFTGGAAINHFRAKAAKKAGEEALKNFKKVPNKALAFIASGLALAASLWNSSLNVTEIQSNIDHRWTGHK